MKQTNDEDSRTIKRFWKEFKELKRGTKVFAFIFVPIVICFLWVMTVLFINELRKLKDTEAWEYVLLGILCLYEIPLLYQFTKRMSRKEKELDRIMAKDLSVKSNMELLHDYEFVTVPEIIFGALSEKSSIFILLFVNYLLLLGSDINAQQLFNIYRYFLVICLMFELPLKYLYLVFTKTRVILLDTNRFRDRKIETLKRMKSISENSNLPPSTRDSN